MKTSALLLVLLLAACQTPISKSSSGIAVASSSAVGKDLVATGHDLDNAVLVGALPANDPAVGCVHGVLKLAGLDTPPCTPPVAPATTPACPAAPPSYVPENAGAISAGAILYIHAQQLKGTGSIVVPSDCKALIGGLVIDGLAVANKAAFPLLPGIGL